MTGHVRDGSARTVCGVGAIPTSRPAWTGVLWSGFSLRGPEGVRRSVLNSRIAFLFQGQKTSSPVEGVFAANSSNSEPDNEAVGNTGASNAVFQHVGRT